MNMFEMHSIISYPVNRMNRDDVGSPKSALFGGVERARVSSQARKRADRKGMKEIHPEIFGGYRTKLFLSILIEMLKTEGVAEQHAPELAVKLAEMVFSKKNGGDGGEDGKSDGDDEKSEDTVPDNAVKEATSGGSETSTVTSKETETDKELTFKVAVYTSPREIRGLAMLGAKKYKDAAEKTAKNGLNDEMESKAKKGKKNNKPSFVSTVVSSIGKAELRTIYNLAEDAADIALFGRMITSSNKDHFQVEGAAMYAHALSVHEAKSEIDYYVAVDDLSPTSAVYMMDHVEFNSACYYQYVAVNIDMLFDRRHLGSMPVESRRKVIDAYVRAFIMSVPGGAKNCMFAGCRPSFIRAVFRRGQPQQMTNAFEEPIRSKNGYITAAIKRFSDYYDEDCRAMCYRPDHIDFPNADINTFCAAIVDKTVGKV